MKTTHIRDLLDLLQVEPNDRTAAAQKLGIVLGILAYLVLSWFLYGWAIQLIWRQHIAGYATVPSVVTCAGFVMIARLIKGGSEATSKTLDSSDELALAIAADIMFPVVVTLLSTVITLFV